MNLLLEWYPGDDAVFVILLVLAQTTIVAALALALERALARNPAARHGVLLTALTCVVLGVVVTVALDRADIALVRLPWPSAEVVHPPPSRFAVEVVDVGDRPVMAEPTGVRLGVADVETRRAKPNAEPTVEAVVRSAVAAALLLWLVGALGFGLRMIGSWREVAALRRGATPIDSASFGSMADRIRRCFGLAWFPTVGVTADVEGPCSVGLFRPLILLPIGFLERFSSAHLEAVLTHETAHLARRDCAVALFQGSIGALFWPHPLVRLLNRRLERAREEICDNHVVEGIGRGAYGRILLEVGEVLSGMRPSAGAVGMFGRDWKLEDRVRGLLDSRRRTMTRMTLPAATLVVMAFSMLTIAIAGAEPKAKLPPKKRARPKLELGDEAFTFPDAFAREELTAKRQKYKAVDLMVKTEKTLEVERALNLPTNLEFQETPLGDVVKFLQDYTGVNVVLDPVGLSAASVAVDTPVTSTLNDVTLELALRVLLDPLNLTYVVRDEVLLITDIQSTEDELETRVYAVGDLVRAVTDSKHSRPLEASEANVDSEPLMELLQSIATDSWESDGGEGTIEYFAPNRSLVIRQTLAVHDSIADLMTGLRRALERPGPVDGLDAYLIEVPADESLLSIEMFSSLFPHGGANCEVIDGRKKSALFTVCSAAERVSISSASSMSVVDRRPIAVGRKENDTLLLIVPEVSKAPADPKTRASVRLHLSCLSRKRGTTVVGTEETLDVRIGDTVVYELRATPKNSAAAEGSLPKHRKRTFVLISPTDEGEAKLGAATEFGM